MDCGREANFFKYNHILTGVLEVVGVLILYHIGVAELISHSYTDDGRNNIGMFFMMSSIIGLLNAALWLVRNSEHNIYIILINFIGSIPFTFLAGAYCFTEKTTTGLVLFSIYLVRLFLVLFISIPRYWLHTQYCAEYEEV